MTEFLSRIFAVGLPLGVVLALALGSGPGSAAGVASGSVAAVAQSVVILDVRTKAEYEKGHVVGARLIDFTAPDFAEKVSQLDRGKRYKVYCAVGGRAGKAEKLMREMGFKDVENLGGVKEAAKKLLAKCEGSSKVC